MLSVSLVCFCFVRKTNEKQSREIDNIAQDGEKQNKNNPEKLTT
jgi:hypothetical protein